MHALILGDHRLLADLLKRDLLSIGYETVEIAVDDDDALRLAEERCPDLILVDDRNSAGVGLQAVQRVCEGKPIAVVYVTGDARGVRRHLPEAVTVNSFGASALRSAIYKAKLGSGGDSNVRDLGAPR